MKKKVKQRFWMKMRAGEEGWHHVVSKTRCVQQGEGQRQHQHINSGNGGSGGGSVGGGGGGGWKGEAKATQEDITFKKESNDKWGR